MISRFLIALLLFGHFSYSQQNFKRINNGDCYASKVSAFVDNLSASEPGFAIAMFSQDSIYYSYNFGITSLEQGIPIDLNTPFFIASVTKSFTSISILQLVEKQKIKLEDNITDLIKGLPDHFNGISIKHLLSHSSGILDYTDYIDTEKGPSTNTEVLNILKKSDSLNFTPGSKFSYNNSAFVLLAEVIEKVSGLSYKDYIITNFLKPLGMNHTYFSSQEISGDRAIGYEKSEDGSYLKKDTENYHVMGSTGMYSSVNDLIKWMRVFDNMDDFLSPFIKQKIFSYPLSDNGKEGYMNMGWFNETLGKRSKLLQGFEQDGQIGVNGGFRSYLIKARHFDFYYVVLTNYGALPHDIMDENLLECFFEREN